jgi:ubiquinone/menaquinone biosynthesis C-methylase UbiE
VHATTIEGHSQPHRLARPVPLLRDPVDRSALYEADGHLVSARGGRRYRILSRPERIYDLFSSADATSSSSRSAAPWDPRRFDAHYEEVGYYEDGETYEAQQGLDAALIEFHHSRVKDVLLEWVTPGPNHAVMDVGCGAGWFLERVVERYLGAGYSPHAVGLEASCMQASFTARRFARRATPSTVVLGNAERLPFADETFDLVTCSETLEQVETPIRALQEMARVLKPGGRLLLSAPSRLSEVMWDSVLGPATYVAKRLRRRGPSSPFSEYYAALYPEELESQVRAAGLQIHAFVQSGLIPHNHYFLQLPQPVVGPLVRAFDWLDRRYCQRAPQLAAHILIWAEKPACTSGRAADRRTSRRTDAGPLA